MSEEKMPERPQGVNGIVFVYELKVYADHMEALLTSTQSDLAAERANKLVMAAELQAAEDKVSLLELKLAQDGWVSVDLEKPPYGVPVWVVYQEVVQHVAYCRDVGEYRTAIEVEGDDSMPETLVSHWKKVLPPAPDASGKKSANG